MRVTAIIAAAGAGRRVGAAVPKQMLELDGTPMLQHSVQTFASHPAISETIVVLAAAVAQAPPLWLSGLLAPTGRPPHIRIVAGGERRQDSVARGFDAANPESDVLLVHDAARPFVTAEIIARVID